MLHFFDQKKKKEKKKKEELLWVLIKTHSQMHL